MHLLDLNHYHSKMDNLKSTLSNLEYVRKLRISVCSLYSLHHHFKNIFNKPNRDRKYSTFTSVIPKWTYSPIWNIHFPIRNIYKIRISKISLYILCHHCWYYSQILTENIGPLHFTLSFQNGQTIQFGILTKYALLQFLCTHCIIIFGNKS